MTRNCIICGGRAGSHEHVFPAALGGRRTNTKIYCGQHNRDYSPLAAILSTQLKAINAQLGVQGDHNDEPHSITGIDSASGRSITLSEGRSAFAQPELLSESILANGVERRMMFSDDQQLQDWLAAERAQGHQVKVGQREAPQPFFLSDVPLSLILGGADGLRAIGYVGQTFLAHYFPEMARAPALNAFKEFTRGIRNEPYVWWDFEPADDLRSSFEFGHRVVVGVDPANAQIYARISLFSTLHFALVLGSVPAVAAQAVIIDIDPLARRPDDMAERRESCAFAPVTPPNALTASLSDVIINGRAQQSFETLLLRIATRNLARTADDILSQLKGADQVSELERNQLFAAVLDPHAQRILNLMRHVVENAKTSEHLAALDPLLEPLVAADRTAINGLSRTATTALSRAQQALKTQMLDDHAAKRLDRERIQALLAGGPGILLVGQTILESVIAEFPED